MVRFVEGMLPCEVFSKSRFVKLESAVERIEVEEHGRWICRSGKDCQ